MNFSAGLMLLRIAACAALLWLRVHPADWPLVAVYLLRGVCWACLAASLTQRFLILRHAVVLRPGHASWWRFW